MNIICMNILILGSKPNLTCEIVEVKYDSTFSAGIFNAILFVTFRLISSITTVQH